MKISTICELPDGWPEKVEPRLAVGAARQGWHEILAAGRAANKEVIPMSDDIITRVVDYVNDFINKPGEESFPLDVLPEAYSGMATAVARSIGTAADYTAVAALAAVGAAAGHAVEAEVGDFSESPALWYLLVGSSTAGKSPALQRMFKPLQVAEEQLWDGWKAQVAEWQSAGEQGPRPVQRRLLASDATVESLAALMEENGSITLVVDEARAIVNGFDKYRKAQSGDKEFYLTTWSQGAVRVDRRTRSPLFVPRGILGIIGTTQPRFVRGFLVDDGSGFGARWLAIFPSIPVPELGAPAVPSTVSKAYARAVLQVLDLQLKNPEKPFTVRFDDEAAMAYDYVVFRLRLAARETEDESVSSFLGKSGSYLLRISLILHLMHWSAKGGPLGNIPSKTVLAALRLFLYFKRQRTEILKLDATSPEVQGLVQWMKLGDHQTVTTRQICSSKHIKAEEAERIMQAAAEAGFGDVWQEPIRGRGGHRLVFRLRVHEPQEPSDELPSDESSTF